MEKITLDEKNKRRIQKVLKQEIDYYYGYEQDIEILEQTGELTETLARKVFSEIMNDAQRIRTILEPEENDEFKDLIEEVYSKYDSIPKPQELEEYGFYDGAYTNMGLNEVYSNMQIAFEVKELDRRYYESRDLRNIASTVINSIDGVEKYQIKIQPDAKEKLQKIQKELRNLLNAEKTDIQGIQERIELYNGYATDIWNDYLTDIDDVQNSQYRWIVHNLTKGELDGNFRNKYMSTSLITNNAMGRYGKSDYGLIIKPKHIVCASYRDTYTLNTRDDEENLFNIRPPLMLPQEIEDICIQQTIEENGEMLNYETTPIYSEVVVDKYEIEGVYYISYGEKELAKDYDRAKKVADERGVPLIERDISKYRAEYELEPMTDKAKMNLCRNILWKCCSGDRKLEQIYSQFANRFVESNFQDFYEKFMQLKENPKFSKEDILRAFADVTRGDVDFGEISQNIDEMYKGIDLNNINYSELSERATKILEETTKEIADGGARINKIGGIIMDIDNKQVEEFEKRYKDTIFSKINEVGSSQFELISQMKKNVTNLGQTQVSIPNVYITLNNKIVELSQEFRKAGISIFSKEFENYNLVGSSFLGDAIINDLIDKLVISNDKLSEYSKKIENVTKQRNERVLALQNVNPIRKIFSRIRALFVPVQPVDLSLTEEEQSMLDSSLQEYKDIDSEIWNYNLEDNIVQALVKEITGPQKFGDFDIPHKYDEFKVQGLLEESVIPDLKKLGLEHLVPKLQEALIEEYKKDLSASEIYQVNDERRTLRQHGIELSDFSMVDKTSSASDRQATISAIEEELRSVQEANQDKVQESTDRSLDD